MFNLGVTKSHELRQGDAAAALLAHGVKRLSFHMSVDNGQSRTITVDIDAASLRKLDGRDLIATQLEALAAQVERSAKP